MNMNSDQSLLTFKCAYVAVNNLRIQCVMSTCCADIYKMLCLNVSLFRKVEHSSRDFDITLYFISDMHTRENCWTFILNCNSDCKDEN
jgi:hypothetical protein